MSVSESVDILRLYILTASSDTAKLKLSIITAFSISKKCSFTSVDIPSSAINSNLYSPLSP